MTTTSPEAVGGPGFSLDDVTDRVRKALEPVRKPIDDVLEIPRLGTALKVVFAYIFLVEIVIQFLFGRIDIPLIEIGVPIEVGFGAGKAPLPRGLFLTGAVLGALYGLVAMGLILVYRANRIINFAQAQLGAVPATVCLLLVAKRGWPYFVVLPLMLVAAAAMGAAVEVAVIRRFSNSPRLILTVATIGVGFLLLVMEFYAKEIVGGGLLDTLSLEFPTPFQNIEFAMGPVIATGDHFFAVAVVGALVVAVSAFFKFTDIGIAVRASAENGERASLLGIPVKRVSTIVWMIAAVVSAIGVFLRAPLVGLNLTGFVGPSILLFGLAVGVLAKMESLPMAMGAGMLIGIIDRSVFFSTGRAALSSVAMLVVVIIGLLAQRKNLSRAQDLGASSWQAIKDYKGVPSELANTSEVVTARAVVAAVVALLTLGAPFLLGASNTPEASLAVIYAIVGVSLVILTGWSGQISLGQFAISGIGAAVTGGLAANYNWDVFAALGAGALAGAFAAVLIGLPALRIQGLFLAVTTLAFAFAVPNYLLSREFFPWLLPKDLKFIERPILYGKFDLTKESELLGVTFSPDAKFYYFTLVFLALCLAAARSLRKNRSGRILIGVRDNGRVMQAFGVNLARTRISAFAISGFMAALAGGLLAYQDTVVEAGQFAPERSIELFIMAVIGGIGSLPGAMLGAVYVLGVPLLPGLQNIENIELLNSGLGLLLLLYFLPGGLSEGMFKTRDNYLRWVAGRRGIHVPSLIADSLQKGDDGIPSVSASPDDDAVDDASETAAGLVS